MDLKDEKQLSNIQAQKMYQNQKVKLYLKAKNKVKARLVKKSKKK